MLRALFWSLRPHQWFKNLFVGAPLLFAKQLMHGPSLLLAAVAVALFSLLSGAVYLINDLFDIEKDRAHPKKCFRPIPAGRLPLGLARSAAALLILVSLGLSLRLGLPFFACAASYLVLNLAYSLALKHIPFVDVLSIASGFLLRVVAGAAAIGVVASPWLLLCTFLLACYLGFGKRAHELATAPETRAAEQRPVLSRYRQEHLRPILWILALATCAAYGLYTLSPHTRAFFGTTRLVYTTPFAALGLVRFLQLISRRGVADSPTDAMLRDPLFMANLGLWAAVVATIIYWRNSF
ncbi:MAG: decaprenyl-phosphate phosphoribosyltransferase [Deltaproteobacteria bacterium]|nr:decaprenyl-phosphate phosphoribosyltransferase [Deltaproteobacteria bacterium]